MSMAWRRRDKVVPDLKGGFVYPVEDTGSIIDSFEVIFRSWVIAPAIVGFQLRLG